MVLQRNIVTGVFTTYLSSVVSTGNYAVQISIFIFNKYIRIEEKNSEHFSKEII